LHERILRGFGHLQQDYTPEDELYGGHQLRR